MKQNNILKFYSKLPHEDFPSLRDFIMYLAGRIYTNKYFHQRNIQNRFIDRDLRINTFIQF
jgi:hypothetical protein